MSFSLFPGAPKRLRPPMQEQRPPRPVRLARSALLFTILAVGGALAAVRPEVGPDPSRSPAPQEATTYTCVMHPDVRTAAPGTCPVCGMPLVSLAALRSRLDYRLELAQDPEPARPGEPVRWRFLFRNSETGAPVREFERVHEMLFHLFVVSDDLAFYRHVHPEPEPDGAFTLETVLPEAKRYELFCDIFPKGGAPRVVRRTVVAGGARGDAPGGASLLPDIGSPKTAGDVRFALAVLPPEPVAGRATRLIYRLTDARTGLPVTDLEPYLGAWGHALALREDLSDFVHAHAPISSAAGPRAKSGGPRVVYDLVFPRPGRHRVWCQVERAGRVETVAYTLSVSRLDRIARWDGGSWRTVSGGEDAGFDGPVRAAASFGGELYVGGDFTKVGGASASHVARWNGRRWSGVGAGTDGNVWALAVVGDSLYAGGEFRNAGGRPAAGVARWNAGRWSAVGGGVSETREPQAAPAVYALASRGGELYAGGRFEKAGRVAASGVARWNGSAWAPLGRGVSAGDEDGVVRALALRGSEVFAGGRFLVAGDARARGVARWNGERWAALGGGVHGGMEQVFALAVSGGDLWAGGMFAGAGGAESAANLARWNGTEWTPAGLEAGEGVWTIAAAPDGLYVGGTDFRLPTGEETHGVVRRIGAEWSSLGGGLGTAYNPGPVMTIVRRSDGVFAAGDAFRLPEPAGGKER